MKNQKKFQLYIILCSFIAILFVSPLFAEDITLNVGKDTYVKEMPKDVDSLQKLVKELVDMYNTKNSDYVKLSDDTTAQIDSLANDLEIAKENLSTIHTSIDTVTNDITVNKTEIINEIKNLNHLALPKTLGVGAGLSISPDLKYYQLNAMGIFNVTSSVFIGLNCGILTSPMNGVITPTIGCYIGSWIF